jgi:hypothetical protein
MREATNPSNLVLMDGPKLLRATWITQYYLTISTMHGTAAGEGWYDEGSLAEFSIHSPIYGGEGIRYVFTGWTGDFTGTELSGITLMDSPKIIFARWKTQFWVTVDPGEGEINGTSQWVDEGSTYTITAKSPSMVLEKESRLVFVGWSGSITSDNVTVEVIVTQPILLKANWKAQYYLSIVTQHSKALGEGWYDRDSEASFSLESVKVASGLPGVDYVFDHWEGDFSGTYSKGTIKMDSPKILIAVWRKNYIALYVTGIVATMITALIIWKRYIIVPKLGSVLSRLTEPIKKKPPPSAAGVAHEAAKIPRKTGIEKPTFPHPIPNFCPNCGTKTYVDSRFCRRCGCEL